MHFPHVTNQVAETGRLLLAHRTRCPVTAVVFCGTMKQKKVQLFICATCLICSKRNMGKGVERTNAGPPPLRLKNSWAYTYPLCLWSISMFCRRHTLRVGGNLTELPDLLTYLRRLQILHSKAFSTERRTTTEHQNGDSLRPCGNQMHL